MEISTCFIKLFLELRRLKYFDPTYVEPILLSPIPKYYPPEPPDTSRPHSSQTTPLRCTGSRAISTWIRSIAPRTVSLIIIVTRASGGPATRTTSGWTATWAIISARWTQPMSRTPFRCCTRASTRRASSASRRLAAEGERKCKICDSLVEHAAAVQLYGDCTVQGWWWWKRCRVERSWKFVSLYRGKVDKIKEVLLILYVLTYWYMVKVREEFVFYKRILWNIWWNGHHIMCKKTALR